MRHWSLFQCLTMVISSPWRHARAFAWSLGLGNLVAVTAVLVGLPLAWMARWRSAAAVAVLVLIAVCLALPGPLF